MAEELKCIKTIDDNVVIFPVDVEHKVFSYLSPITAGFCRIGKNKVICYGESVSLNIGSNKKDDSIEATRTVFGIDAMLDLI